MRLDQTPPPRRRGARSFGWALAPLLLLLMTLLLAAPAGPSRLAVVTGGLEGAMAGVVQVALLMGLRTAIVYQYAHGGSFMSALSTLWAEGGVRRLYSGVAPVRAGGRGGGWPLPTRRRRRSRWSP